MLWTENDAENTSHGMVIHYKLVVFGKIKRCQLYLWRKIYSPCYPTTMEKQSINGLKDPERNYWAKEQITGSPKRISKQQLLT